MSTDNRQRGWRLIYRSPGRGLRYFVRTIGGEQEAIQRVAVADNSGETPDLTEDGVLWVDLDRSWYVADARFDIPVVQERGEHKLWTSEGCVVLFDLLGALRQPSVLGEEALRVRCKLHKSGGVGARAILKCLALGVNPNEE